MANARIALWVNSGLNTWDSFICSGWAHALPQLNDPGDEQEDVYGNVHRTEPAGTPEQQRWTQRLRLALKRPRYALQLDSTATRDLVEFVRHWFVESSTRVYIFVEGHGWNSAGAEVTKKRYYRGKLSGSPPEWLLGELSSAQGSAPPLLNFSFVIDDEGTYSDFDGPFASDAAFAANLTSRGSRFTA